MSYCITYNNITSQSLGIEIVRRPDIPAPEPIYEPYVIPGRDGILMPADITYGPLEIDVEMNFIAGTADTVGAAYRAAKNWLSGSGELSFSDDTTVFYRVYQASITEAERTSRRIETFTAHFVCDPYTYFTAGKTAQEYTGSGTGITVVRFTNPHSVESHPTYTAILASAGYVGVGGNLLTLPRSAVIDTERGIVTDYANGDIINAETSGNFEDLYLVPGENLINLSKVSSLKIVPNWRAL